MMNNKAITTGFILSASVNIVGVLIFTRLFTNTVIPETDPAVMSNFGLVMIMLWGLAYLSVAGIYHKVRWMIGVFAIEKFIYGFVWTRWILQNDLAPVYERDTMAGIFYTVYGLNDWLFFIFFTYVFIRLMRVES